MTKDTIKPSRTGLFGIILDHYGNTTRVRSDEELLKESQLFPGIKFRRWYCMPAGVALQFCVGSVYSWSVFNKNIELTVDGSLSNRAPITFTIALTLLGLSAAVMGPWLERNGPRKAALLGSALFFAGNMMTALALYLKLMWLIWISYGLMGGAGIGLCYIAPVSALQKWFPDQRGLASGVAVAGFGAGSIAMSKVQVILMDLLDLPLTFVTLGCSYLCIMGVAAFVLRAPLPGYMSKTIRAEKEIIPPNEAVSIDVGSQKSEPTLIEALKSKDFIFLYTAFLCNIIFGLVLLSRLSNMITDIFKRDSHEAATVVAINGGFNLAGRLLFSVTSDSVGRKNCYVFMLSVQLVVLGLFPFLTSGGHYIGFLAAMWGLTACYGAGFSVIPAFISDKFGTGNVGAVHGVALTAWSAASLIGGIVFTTIFNYLSDEKGDDISPEYPYNANSYWLLAVVVIGLAAALEIKGTEGDEKFWNFFKIRK